MRLQFFHPIPLSRFNAKNLKRWSSTNGPTRAAFPCHFGETFVPSSQTESVVRAPRRFRSSKRPRRPPKADGGVAARS
jgi:hypothetical protein